MCRQLALAGFSCLGMSCTAPRPALVVTNPDPSVKIPAIEKAVREKNRSVVPQLIKDLESDDPAVRFYANHALQKLTGENFGFRYFGSDHEREAAAEKWRQWLAGRPAEGKGERLATQPIADP